MIKIKYVGAKTDGERAFKDNTGIEWFPGSVHEVTEEHAAMMLRHPDVFEQVAGKAVKPAAAAQLKAVATNDLDADDEAIAREEAARKATAEAEAAKAKELEAKQLEAKAIEKEKDETAKPVKPAKKVAAKKAAKKAPKKAAKA